MVVTRLDDPDDDLLADYRNVSEADLMARRGLFVAEGRLVVTRLLEARHLVTRSVLVTETACSAIGDALESRPDVRVDIVPQHVMNGIIGFDIHRGCLALGERPAARDWRELTHVPDSSCVWEAPAGPLGPESAGPAAKAVRGTPERKRVPGPRRLVVLERIGNADNVGSIFRNGAAFGMEGILLGPSCADPLYRKAIRTSMAASLTMPFAHADEWPGVLRDLRGRGWFVVGLTPAANAETVGDVAHAVRERPCAVVLGHEGDGLTAAALDACDAVARIPMAGGTDSLNVATAAAVALYELTRR